MRHYNTLTQPWNALILTIFLWRMPPDLIQETTSGIPYLEPPERHSQHICQQSNDNQRIVGCQDIVQDAFVTCQQCIGGMSLTYSGLIFFKLLTVAMDKQAKPTFPILNFNVFCFKLSECSLLHHIIPQPDWVLDKLFFYFVSLTL